MDRRLLAVVVTILLIAIGSLGACGDDPPTTLNTEQPPAINYSVWMEQYKQDQKDRDMERRIKALEIEECKRQQPHWVWHYYCR